MLTLQQLYEIYNNCIKVENQIQLKLVPVLEMKVFCDAHACRCWSLSSYSPHSTNITLHVKPLTDGKTQLLFMKARGLNPESSYLRPKHVRSHILMLI